MNDVEERRSEKKQTTYVISVAAQLAGMHPQTLRQYDRLGLVTPSRTKGRGRRYTSDDVALLREVQRLSQEEGVNLAGIRRIIELNSEIKRLERVTERLRRELEQQEERDNRVFTASPLGEVAAVRRGERPPSPHSRLSRALEARRRAEGEDGALVVWRPPHWV